MKTISILVPTYNEEENILLIYKRIKTIFETSLINYNFELIYIDNYSLDKSREIIKRPRASMSASLRSARRMRWPG